MKKLKVAVVGVGGIAGTCPDESLRRAGLRWLRHQRRGAVVGAEHGVDKLYSSVEDLWQDDEIDIVDICTPNMYRPAGHRSA